MVGPLGRSAVVGMGELQAVAHAHRLVEHLGAGLRRVAGTGRSDHQAGKGRPREDAASAERAADGRPSQVAPGEPPPRGDPSPAQPGDRPGDRPEARVDPPHGSSPRRVTSRCRPQNSSWRRITSPSGDGEVTSADESSWAPVHQQPLLCRRESLQHHSPVQGAGAEPDYLLGATPSVQQGQQGAHRGVGKTAPDDDRRLGAAELDARTVRHRIDGEVGGQLRLGGKPEVGVCEPGEGPRRWSSRRNRPRGRAVRRRRSSGSSCSTAGSWAGQPPQPARRWRRRRRPAAPFTQAAETRPSYRATSQGVPTASPWRVMNGHGRGQPRGPSRGRRWSTTPGQARGQRTRTLGDPRSSALSAGARLTPPATGRGRRRPEPARAPSGRRAPSRHGRGGRRGGRGCRPR